MKSKLRKSLKEKKFVFTAETSPPDTGNKQVIVDQVECLRDLADAINVTVEQGPSHICQHWQQLQSLLKMVWNPYYNLQQEIEIELPSKVTY